MSVYNKKGDINIVLKNIFINTSTPDIVHTLIPALCGTTMCLPSSFLSFSSP